MTTFDTIVAKAEEPDDGSVLTTLPWLWIAAWLIGWALLTAIAAWLVGTRASTVWVWVAVWAVPGLVVSALLTRLAVQANEREAAALRLHRAASDIATLEQRLQFSSQNFVSTTQTLSDATQLLVEQVDTSRDDLRNQIGSAQQLAQALKQQTEALVAAQSGFRSTVVPRTSVLPAPEPEPEPVKLSDPAASIPEPPTFVQPPLGLRPVVEMEAEAEAKAEEVPDDAPVTSPAPELPVTSPLGLRPAPAEDIPVFEMQAILPESDPLPETEIQTPDIPELVSADTPDTPLAAAPIRATKSGSWKWSDMLATVDSAPAPIDSGTVVGILTDEGLAPLAIVADGLVADAAGIWERKGVEAMVALLDIRIGEPAGVLAARMRDDADDAAVVTDFVHGFEARLSMDPGERLYALIEERGRAWLIAKTALGALEG